MGLVSQVDDVPAIEPLGNDTTIAVPPIIAHDEPAQMGEDGNVYNILIGETSNPPAQATQSAVNDVLLVENEDYEVSHPVSEPHVWLPPPSALPQPSCQYKYH